MKFILTGFFLLCLALRAPAEEFEPLAVTDPPTVDGKLDDAVWARAPVISDFVQRFPREGAPATERTEVRILYTQDALYIGFRAEDHQPGSIRATVLKRDDGEVVNDDQFAVAIDSQNDGRSGFWFSTNPLGVRVDAQFFNEGDLWEDNWNGVWECRASMDPGGWTTEIEIPFSTLRFPPGNDVVMGMNLFRRIIRTNEALFSPLIPLSYSNGTPNVSIARKFRFHNIRSGRKLQVKPYGLSGVQDGSTTANFEGKAGVDLRYPLASGFTSYFSLNTDFAEAEADELQVNLTRFPLFFPEKRDFFLENSGDFSFGVPQDTELFFSRRIGLSDTGNPVPVLFGARAAGRIGGLDLGLMNVQTREDNGQPAENFSAARFRADIAPRSYAGGIFTSRYSNNMLSNTFGADLLLYFRNNISLSGFASTVSKQAGASGGNNAYYFNLGRGGEATSFHLSYLDVGDAFDPAVGFVRRLDVQTWNAGFALPQYWNAHHIRNITPGIQADLTHDHEGVLLDTSQQASLDVVFESEDQLSFYWRHAEELVPEAFAVFRGTEIPAGRYSTDRAGVTAATKQGRPLSMTFTFSSGDFYGGTMQEIAPSLVYRMSRNVRITETLATNLAHHVPDNFTVLLSRSRIDWSLDTKLSASALMQYDNDTQQTAVNLRLTYLFREGTELFIVYDHGADSTQPSNSHGRLLVKFTYLFH